MPFCVDNYSFSKETKKKADPLDRLQLVDKDIDKLTRTVEKDADFVISRSSAYKGTAELEMAKSVKTSDFSEVFLYIAFAFN